MHMHSHSPWCHVDVKVQWQTFDFSLHRVDGGQELRSPGLVLGSDPSERDLNDSLNLELWFKPQPLMEMLLNLCYGPIDVCDQAQRHQSQFE